MSLPKVFLHGWAQSQQIWFGQRDSFADASFLNLPGHGGAEDRPADQWTGAIIEQLPDEPVLLVGWSIGGMLAMQIASKYPERIAALVLVATTPRFRESADWLHGSSKELFRGFRQAVESGSPKALNRFFALILHGDDIGRSDYNRLAKAAVDRKNRVSGAGLQNGLELLEKLDLRGMVQGIKQPTLVIHGEADAVVPVGAGVWLADNLPGAQKHLLPSCGHAPFLSQTEIFNEALEAWCHRI